MAKKLKVQDLLGAVKLSDEEAEEIKKRIAEYCKKVSEDSAGRKGLYTNGV